MTYDFSVQALAVVAAVFLLSVPYVRKAYFSKAQPSKSSLPLPPYLPSRVPVIGHLWGVFRESHRYFIRLCRESPMPIFSVAIGSQKIIVISPTLGQSISNTKNIEVTPLVASSSKSTFKLTPLGLKLLMFDGHQGHAFGQDVAKFMRKELGSIQQIRTSTEIFDEHLQGRFSKVQRPEVVRLGDWMFDQILMSLITALWGKDNKIAEPEFARSARTMFTALTTVPLFSQSAKVKAAQGYVRNSLQTPHSIAREKSKLLALGDNAEATPSDWDFFARFESMCKRNGVNNNAFTDMQLVMMFAFVSGMSTASIWTLYHLVADPALFSAVATELRTYVKSAAKEGGDIDLEAITLASPHLLATWYEVFRFRLDNSNAHYVNEDTEFAGTHLLPKGSIVISPIILMHQDPETWGTDATSFNPKRFILPGGQINQALVKKIYSLGFGRMICPGRFLGHHLVMTALIRLLLTFDIESPNGQVPKVPPRDGGAALGAGPATDDLEMLLKPRTELGSFRFNCANLTQRW